MCLSIFCGSPEELWTAPPPSPPVRLVTKHPNYIILWDSCLMQLFQALEPFLFISFLQLHFLSAGIRNVILLRSHWLKELWKGLLVLGSAGCGFSMVVVVEERLGTAWKVTSYTNLTCPKHKAFIWTLTLVLLSHINTENRVCLCGVCSYKSTNGLNLLRKTPPGQRWSVQNNWMLCLPSLTCHSCPVS